MAAREQVSKPADRTGDITMTGKPDMAGQLAAEQAGTILAELASALEEGGVSRPVIEQIRDARRAVMAELTGDGSKRQAEIEQLAGTLTPPEVMQHAEQLIRERYPVLHPLYPIWGKIADELNSMSHIPELTAQRPRDTRLFNHFQAMAWAVIDQYHGRTGRNQHAE